MIEATAHTPCTVCGGPVAANEPGNVRSKTGGLEHAVCHERGAPLQTPIVNLNDGTKCCLNLQYNCGHYAYGPVHELPETCPECGDEAV